MGHFNTTQESGQKLKEFKQKAERQEDVVHRIFKKQRRQLTASEVLRLYPEKGVLLGSIRRALSNLKNENILELTNIKREGLHGRPEKAYQLYIGQMILF